MRTTPLRAILQSVIGGNDQICAPPLESTLKEERSFSSSHFLEIYRRSERHATLWRKPAAMVSHSIAHKTELATSLL